MSETLVNPPIARETRIAMYELQYRLRVFEKRAYDLFLQNLVKGTSHLALGQEAVAAGFATAMRRDDWTFCTYRGHDHTLARGVSMLGCMAELLGRANGVLAARAVRCISARPTSSRWDRMRSSARSCASRSRRLDVAVQENAASVGLFLRRRHDEHRRVPRGVESGCRLEAAGRVRVREQPVYGIHVDRIGHGGETAGGGSRRVVRARADRGRRQRCRRMLSSCGNRVRACAPR